MKAKIKKTGEIVNLAFDAVITLDQCDSWGNPIEMNPEEVELIQEPTEDSHWQDVRERTAIAVLGSLSANSQLVYNSGEEKIDFIKRAIRYADALVEQLKKK